MSFFEDMFDGFRRDDDHHHRGRHGRHDHHDDHSDHDHDGYYGQVPRGTAGAAPPTDGPTTTCPKCRAVVPLLPSTRFCACCGGPLVAKETCAGCGERLTPAATFCHGCGRPA